MTSPGLLALPGALSSEFHEGESSENAPETRSAAYANRAPIFMLVADPSGSYAVQPVSNRRRVPGSIVYTRARHLQLSNSRPPGAPSRYSWTSRRTKDAVTGEEARRKALQELRLAAANADHSNWDGYGAAPVSAAAVDHAERLLHALPVTLPSPEIAIDPDGEVALDWYSGPDTLVSLSVSLEGDLSYVAQFGGNRARGVERFSTLVPDAILSGVRRVVSGDDAT